MEVVSRSEFMEQDVAADVLHVDEAVTGSIPELDAFQRMFASSVSRTNVIPQIPNGKSDYHAHSLKQMMLNLKRKMKINRIKNLLMPKNRLVCSRFFLSTTIATFAMGVSPRAGRMIVHAAMIGTVSSTVSSIGQVRSTALQAARSRTTKFEPVTRRITGIGCLVSTQYVIPFWFTFGSRLYTGQVHVFPGDSPLISRPKYLNYHPFCKIIQRLEDG